MTTDQPGDGADRVRAAGIETVQIPLSRLRKRLDPRLHVGFALGFFPEVSSIRRLIRRYQASIVQICGLMHPHGAVAARLEGIPVVWQLMSTFAPPPLRWVLMPVVIGLADVLMSTGIATAQAHPGAHWFGERLVIFFPPVDTALFRPDPAQREVARRELGVPPDGLLVGTVGNLTWQKGHEFLVKAAAELSRCVPKLYVRILGARTPTQVRYYQRHVLNPARKLGLCGNGHFDVSSPGNRIHELLPAFDVFVLTSRAEGAPTAALEAMACGLPVVATDVGSVREVVDEGTTGYVVHSGRPREVVAALMKLIKSPELRIEMGTEARCRALERYAIEKCADSHVHAFEMALSKQTRS